MARVQLVMPDADRDRFVHQARREGMSLSAWLRAAACERLETRQSVKLFESPEDVKDVLQVMRRAGRSADGAGLGLITCE